MSRSKAKRKQQTQHIGGALKKARSTATVTTPLDVNAPKTLDSLGLHEDDLDIATDTLNTLAANPSVMRSKGCKDLRTAVYKFRQACKTGLNASGRSPLISSKS